MTDADDLTRPSQGATRFITSVSRSSDCVTCTNG